MADNEFNPGGEELNNENLPISPEGKKFLQDLQKERVSNDPRIRSFKPGGDFDPKYDFGLSVGQNADRNRWENQSGLEQFWNFAVNSLQGEIVGGTMESVGYLAGVIGELFQPAEEGQLKFDNWLAQAGRALKESTKEDHPIFEEEPGKFSPFSPSFWAANGSSIFSTLSLAIPGYAVMRGLTYATKGIKALKALKAIKLGKDLRNAAGKVIKPAPTVGTLSGILTTAISSRQAESTMEAAGVYDKLKKELPNRINPETGEPFTTKEAAKFAAQGGADTYAWNWLALATDIPQYAMMLRGPKLIKAASASLAKRAMKSLALVGGAGVSEYIEEGYQHVVQEEAVRSTYLSAGLQPDDVNLGLLDRIAVNSTSDEGLTAASIGFLGGAAQVTMFRKVIPGLFSKRKEVKGVPEMDEAVAGILKEAKKADLLGGYQKLMINASENLDDISFNFVAALATLDISFDRIKSGDLEGEISRLEEKGEEMLKDTEGAESEEIRTRLDIIKNDLISIEEIYRSVQSSFKHKVTNKVEIVEEQTRNTFLLKKLKKEIQEHSKQGAKIAAEYEEDLDQNTTRFRKLSEKIRGFEIYKERLESELKVTELEDKVKTYKEKTLKKVNKNIKELNEERAQVEKQGKIGDYTPRVEMPYIAYNIERSRENLKNLADKINRYGNKNFIKNLDRDISEIKNNKEAKLTSTEQPANSLDDEGEILDKEDNNWGSEDGTTSTLQNVMQSMLIGGTKEGENGKLVFKKNQKFVKELIDRVDKKLGRKVAKSLYGNAFPNEAKEGQEAPEMGPGIEAGDEVWRLNPNSPIETFRFLSNVFSEDASVNFHENKSDYIKQNEEFKDIVKNIIDEISEDSKSKDNLSGVATDGPSAQEQQEQSTNKGSKIKPKYTLTIPQQYVLYTGAREDLLKYSPDLDETFGKGWDYINDPNGLQENQEIRIIRPKEDLNNNLTKFYKENIITVANVPLYVQVKIKNKWVNLGWLTDQDKAEKDPNAAQLNKTGSGPAQLLAIREKLFNNATPIKTRVVKKGSAILKYDKTGHRGTARNKNIKLYQNRVILSVYGTDGYYVENEENIESEIASWNRSEEPQYLNHHLGRPHLIIKDVDGTARPHLLDTIQLVKVDGAIESIMSLLEEASNFSKIKSLNDFRRVKEDINNITYIGSKTLKNEEGFSFNITPAGGITFSLPGESKDNRISWEEFDSNPAEIEAFFSNIDDNGVGKVMHFIEGKANKTTVYTNRVTNEVHPTYNDYVLDYITDTDWTGKFEQTKFSFEDPFGTIIKEDEGSLDDESPFTEGEAEAFPETSKKDPKIPQDSKGNDIILPGFSSENPDSLDDTSDNEDRLFSLHSGDIIKKVQVIDKVLEFLEAINVPVDLVNFGSTPALAAANFIKGVVEITDNIENRAAAWNELPEEAAHFWYRLLKDNVNWDSTKPFSDLKKDLLKLVEGREEYKDLLTGQYTDQYKTLYAFKEEAIGQVIGKLVTRIENGSASTQEKTIWQKIKDFIRRIIGAKVIEALDKNDPFVIAAERIINSDISDLLTIDEYKALEQLTSEYIPLTEDELNKKNKEEEESEASVNYASDYISNLLGKKFKRRTRFLNKTLDKYITIVEPSLASDKNNSEIIIKNKFTKEELENYSKSGLLKSVDLSLYSFDELIRKYKKNPIPLRSNLKLNGVTRSELDLLNEVRNLILQENPNKKSIDVFDFVNEVKVYVNAKYEMSIRKELQHLNYNSGIFTGVASDYNNRDFSLLSNFRELTGIHRKYSIIFNNSYYGKSIHNGYGHFAPSSPTAFGSLTPFDGGNKVLLHEIQSDFYEKLNFVYNLTQNPVDSVIPKIKKGEARITGGFNEGIELSSILKLDSVFLPIVRMLLDNQANGELSDVFIKVLTSRLSEQINEEISLWSHNFKSLTSTNAIDLSFINTTFEIMKSATRRWDIVTEKDIDEYKNLIKNSKNDGERQFDTLTFKKKIAHRYVSLIKEKYNLDNIILDDRAVRHGETRDVLDYNDDKSKRVVSFIFDTLVENMKFYNANFVNKFKYYNYINKEKSLILHKYYRALRALKRLDNLRDLKKQTVELHKEMFNKLWFNVSLLSNAIGKRGDDRLRERAEEFALIEKNLRENVKTQNVKNDLSLSKDEIKRELDYFTPLVHHLIQTFLAKGKGSELIFSGYEITKLTQKAESSAKLYAGPEEVKKGIVGKVGPMYTAFKKIKGIKLEYIPSMGGFKGEDVGGYKVNLDNYNYKEPILYSLKREDEGGVYKKWDEKEETAWFKSNFPDVAVTVTNRLIKLAKTHGKDAFGYFKNGAAYIYKNVKVGAAYYEGFHAVFNLYTDEGERNKLYTEAKNRWGGENNLEIEKRMAEAFRNYMIGLPYNNEEVFSKKTPLRQFFDDIIIFVKKMTSSPLTLEEYFNNIKRGTFNKSDLKRDISKFNDGFHMLIPDFTSKEQDRRIKTIAKFVWANIQGKLRNGVLKEVEDADLRKILIEVRQSLEELVSENGIVTKRGTQIQKDGIDKMVAYFDLLSTGVIKFYANFGFILKNESELEKIDLIEGVKDTLTDLSELHDFPHFQISLKEKANPIVTRYIYFMSTGRLDDLQFDDSVNFHEAWSDISKITSGATSIEEMIRNLQDNVKNKPFLKEIIGHLSSTKDERFKSAFYATFSNQNMRFLTMGNKGNEKTLYMTNRKNLSRTILKNWEDSFNSSKYSKLENGIYIPVVSKIKQELNRLDSLFKRYNNNKDKMLGKDYKIVQNYYKVLGISVSINTLEDSLKYGTKNEMASFLKGPRGRGLMGVMERVINNKAHPYSTDKYEHEGSTLLALAKRESRSRTDLYNASTTGAKGNKKHGIAKQSFLSNLLDTFKFKGSAAKGLFYRYYKNPFYKIDDNHKSLFLRSLEGTIKGKVYKHNDEDFVKNFDWATLESVNHSGVVKEYSEMTPKDKLLTDLELFLKLKGGYSWFMIPTPSDKSTSRVLKLKRLEKKEAFEELLIQARLEHARIKNVLRQLDPNDNIFVPPNKQVENYHYRVVKGKRIIGLGVEFVMFPELNAFIEDGVLMDFNKAKAAELIGEELQKEISDFHDKLTNEKGFRVIYGNSGSFIRTQTSIKENSIKEYRDEKTREIDTYALSEDFILNYMVWNNEMIKVFHGDPAYYSNSDVFTKRAHEIQAAGRRAREHKTHGVKPRHNMLILKEPIYNLKEDGFADPALVADGQGYISFNYYIRYIKGLGEWSDKMEEAANRIKEGKATSLDNSLILKPLKFFTYNFDQNGPLQIKHSVIPLIPSLVRTDTKLAKLAKIMEEHDIDEVNFESGIKVGSRSVIDFNKIDDVDIKSNIIKISNKGRFIITETDMKEDPPKFGSQIRKLIFGLVKNDSKYKVGNITMSGKEIKEELHSLISTNYKLSSVAVENLLKDPKRLQKSILKQFSSRGIPESVEKMLKIDESTGKFKYPLSFPGILKKIEQVLNSFYRNTVTVSRVRGYNAVQVSAFGLSENLKFIKNKDGSRYAEIEISERLFKEYGGDIEKIEESFLKGIIYRTPTQSKASMLPVKIVRVLPKEMGDIAILPLAIVVQMGSDFDIDKVSVMLKDPKAKKGSKASRNNRIIELMSSILTSPIHFDEVSTPIGHKTLEKHRRKLLSDEEREIRNKFENKRIGSYNTQFDYYVSNMSGKTLIGRFARHIVHHAISNNVNWQLPLPIKINNKSITTLGADPNGKITNDLQEILNAVVDNTKDPIAGDLNINLVTAEVLALLVRSAGLNLALDYITHPVIIKIVSEFYKVENIKHAINRVILTSDFKEEYGALEGFPNLDKKIINSETNEDKAKIAKSFSMLFELSKSLGKDMTSLGFDGSKNVGSTLQDKRKFLSRMSEEIEQNGFNNVLNQAKGFPHLMAAFQHGILDPLRVVGDIIPTMRGAFDRVHAALDLGEYDTTAREVSTFALMNYMFTENDSPIAKIYSSGNKDRLLKGDNSLWRRIKREREEKPGKYKILDVLDLEKRGDLDYVTFYGKAAWTKDEITDFSQSLLSMFWLPQTRDLARDIVEYSLITNGFSYSPHGFFQLIPAEYWIDTKFSNTKQSVVDYWRVAQEKLNLETYPNLNDFLPKFIENHADFPVFDFVDDYSSLFALSTKYTLKHIKDVNSKLVNSILVNDKIIPISFKIHPDKVTSKANKTGFIKVVINSKDDVSSYLMRKDGVGEDGFIVFNLANKKGDMYYMQEWSENSVIQSNNNIDKYPESLKFQSNMHKEEDMNTPVRLDDEGFSFKQDILYSDPEVENLREQEVTPSDLELKRLVNTLDTREFQKTSKEVEVANKKLDKELKKFLSNFGVRVESVDVLKTHLGDDIIAATDLFKRIIQVAKGEAKIDTLPEEAAHFFVYLLGDNSPLILEMWDKIQLTDIYKEVVDEYWETYKGDEDKVIREAIAKAIAKEMVGEFRKRESDKKLANRISKIINYIINRIKGIFRKISKERFEKEVNVFALGAKMLLDNNLSMPSKYIRSNEQIEFDVISQASVGNFGQNEEGVYYQLASKNKDKNKDKIKEQRPLEDLVSDPTISKVKKIDAILENALDILIRKEKFLKKQVQGSERAKKVSYDRQQLENLIDRKMGVKAIGKFIESSAFTINDAYKQALLIQQKGEKTQLFNNKSVSRELNRVYQVASTYTFIEQVLQMAMSQPEDSQLSQLIGLLQDMKSKIDHIKVIHRTTGKSLIAEWLNEVGSSFFNKEELKSILEMGEQDSTFADRWLRAASQVEDPIVQLVNKAVLTAKQEGRHLSIMYSRELGDIAKDFKEANPGEDTESFSRYIEKLDGKETGFFISKYTPEYYDIFEKSQKLLRDSTDKHSLGEVEKGDKLKVESDKLSDEIFDIYEDESGVLQNIIKDKYKNKEFESISEEPLYSKMISGMRHATDKLANSKRRLYDPQHDRFRIPNIRKSWWTRFKEKGLDSVNISDALRENENDTEFGILDENNQPIGEVPTHFINSVPIDELSFDLPASVQMYYNMANQNFAIRRILDKLTLTEDIIKSREVKVVENGKVIRQMFGRKSEKLRTIKGGKTAELLEDYIKAQVYGQKKIKTRQNIAGFSTQKALGLFLKGNAILSLSSNVFSAVANPIIGDVMQSIEGFAGQFYKAGDFAAATAIYGSQLPQIVADASGGKDLSKVNVLNELFDSIQEYATFETGVAEVTNKYGNVFTGKGLMFLQSIGEHWIQSRLMIAMLLGKTYKNGKIVDIEEGDTSLWEQLEVKDGKAYINGKDVYHTPGFTKQSIKTHMEIIAVNQRLHGNYTDIDRSAAHRTIMGQLVFQFRNWMVPGFDRRWRTKRKDERLGIEMEGNYITTFNFAKNLIKEIDGSRFNIAASWGNLNSMEKSNVYRTMFEAVYILGTVLVLNLFFAKPGDDDDEGFTELFIAYQLNRLYTELLFFSDYRETIKLAKSPAAALSTAEKIMALGEIIIATPTSYLFKGEIPKYKAGTRKGEYKMRKAVSDLTPIWRDYERVKHVRNLLQFFN